MYIANLYGFYITSQYKKLYKFITTDYTICLNNNLRDCEVKEMVESQFRFMYEKIREMSLDTMTAEELKGKIIIGEFVNIEDAREYTERYDEIIARAQKA